MTAAPAALTATQKYDLLTALGSWGLAQEKSVQRQVLRLICLITAHYNWQSGEIRAGQAEIARLWSVDVRTVKREMAAFRERGWVLEKRRGLRGQAAVLGLDLRRILADTSETWGAAGGALARRLDPPAAPAPAEPAAVISFPRAESAQAGGGRWGQIARRLAEQDGALWQAWFAGLTPLSEAGELVLRAPSGFHAAYVSAHYQRRLEGLWGGPVRLEA